MLRVVSIRQSLLINLITVIALLSGGILATTYFRSHQVLQTLSETITGQALEHTEAHLQHFFYAAIDELRTIHSWGRKGQLSTSHPGELTNILMPVMQEHAQISAAVVVDTKGYRFVLTHVNGEWTMRESKPDLWGHRSRWTTWSDNKSESAVSWKKTGSPDALDSWLQNIIRNITLASGSLNNWSLALQSITRGGPSLRVSAAFDTRDGIHHVVVFEILLVDVSRFTTHLEIMNRGRVFALSRDKRLIGLPREPRYADDRVMQADLLKQPHELENSLIRDAVAAFDRQKPGKAGNRPPIMFESGGEKWWGQMRWLPLTGTDRLLMGVVIPESELLGNLPQSQRFWVIIITVIVLALALIWAFLIANRLSRPVKALVEESDRISSGDFATSHNVQTRIAELSRLAQAHGHMRVALSSFLKLKDELKLARAIQQNTFPEEIPSIHGYEIEAWNEPAAETGGDTYDVIGSQQKARDHTIVLPGEVADKVVLLMADATGHGLGPALSATQIHAMVRMAVRMGGDLPQVVGHINQQLHADLHEGRFATAWLGELNADTGLVESFSAGQAPILRFNSKREGFDVLDADTPPFGIVQNLQTTRGKSIQLHQGDILAVISDGVFEAKSPEGRQFGIEAVQRIIAGNCKKHVSKILEAIRAALTEFVGDAPTSDDRTIIIVKRTRP